MAKRWRPPPMSEEGAPPDGEPAGASTPKSTPKITVDEKVVRKMLQVNPAMRDGRTTFQVKRDMENGQPVRTSDKPAPGPAPAPSHAAAGAAAATPARSGGARGELEDTVGFFLRSKAASFNEKLGALAEKRRALDLAQEQAKEELRGQLASFIAMLDEQIVALHGVTVLSQHKELLNELGLTPAQLLELSRKARK